MSAYGFRDNKLYAKNIVVADAIKLESATGGQTAYLYLGSAGALMLNATAPVPDHTDDGTHIATVS